MWHSPVEKFCKTNMKMDINDVPNFRCPCYVLYRELQNGDMIPKWDSRSRLMVYLGNFPYHAGSMALMLKPETLHVAFDDTFSTVQSVPTTALAVPLWMAPRSVACAAWFAPTSLA